MQAHKDAVVSIHYTLTNDEGDVIDSSKGGLWRTHFEAKRRCLSFLGFRSMAFAKHGSNLHSRRLINIREILGCLVVSRLSRTCYRIC